MKMNFELKVWCARRFEYSTQALPFGEEPLSQRKTLLVEYLNAHYPDWKESVLTIQFFGKNNTKQFTRTHVERCIGQSEM